jgi:hypothetical protein
MPGSVRGLALNHKETEALLADLGPALVTTPKAKPTPVPAAEPEAAPAAAGEEPRARPRIAPPAPAAEPPAAPHAAEEEEEETPSPLTPLPEGNPSHPEAARLLEQARRTLRDRQPQKALGPLEKAAALEPTHLGIQRLLVQTRIEARKGEIESLVSSALNHFVANEYGKARKAVSKVIALDPNNKKARELEKILGALG